MGFDNECIVSMESLPGEYFCPVCRTLIYPSEALQAQCTHLYCKPCLAYTAATTQACPYDGYLVTQSDAKPLREVNKGLGDAIGQVQVHCLYYRSSCPWQGSLTECLVHCAACPYGNSPVVCNRCATQIVHRQVQDHAQVCPGVQSQEAQAAAGPAAQQQYGGAANQAGTDEWFQQQQYYGQQYDPYAQPQTQAQTAPPPPAQHAPPQHIPDPYAQQHRPPAPPPAQSYYGQPPALPAQQFQPGPPKQQSDQEAAARPPSTYGQIRPAAAVTPPPSYPPPPPPYAAPPPSYPAPPPAPNGMAPSYPGPPPHYPRPPVDPYSTRPPFYPSDYPPSYDNHRPSFNGKRNGAVLIGWCRICKVDCRTAEGLDHHCQSNDHQIKSMHMLLAMKHRLSPKNLKLSSVDKDLDISPGK